MIGSDDLEDGLGEKSRLQEEIENGFDPKDLIEILDGWELFRKKKGASNTMVKRYCYALD